MGVLGGYTNDIFISYSHIDNQPFGDSRGGWVDIFHEQLQNFVDVHAGRRTKVWRDRRLTGGEVFSDEIEQQLRSSALLVSIVSPGYVRSEWCSRELAAFTAAARQTGDLRIGNLQRVVKVLRLPVDRTALPALLDEVLGGQFYRVDPASGRARDLLLDSSADALQVFRARVDDVAQDVSRLLEVMAQSDNAPAAGLAAVTGDAVFLAWTASDLTEEREKLRRELEARHYRVVPTGAPPLDATRVREGVLAVLGEAKAAIHMVGGSYGFVPEGEQRSILELQSDQELYRAANSTAARIVWLAPCTPAADPRVSAFVDRLQAQSDEGGHFDLLANQPLEALKALVLDRLTPPMTATSEGTGAGSARVYVICDQLDRDRVTPIVDFLFDQSLEVTLPLFEGDAAEIRRDHYETLKECDGVLVFWGKATEGWVRSLLRDLNKVFGLGRRRPYKAASLYVADLPDAGKERFRTREVSFIRSDTAFGPDQLRWFVTQVSGT